MNLSRFALHRRAVVLAMVVALLLAGLQSFRTISRREDPEITIRTCKIITLWPGASAEKIEDLVTDPIEETVYTIDEVKEVTSQSRIGMSSISVDLEDGTSGLGIDQVFDEVKSRVEEARGELPAGCGTPLVNTSFGDVASVCLAMFQVPRSGASGIAQPYSYRELEDFAEVVEKDLKTLDSVARLSVEGVQEEVITLEVDAEAWSKLDLTADDLGQILEARNIVAPGGRLDTEEGRFTVNTSGEFTALEEIRDVIVHRPESGAPVRLSDLPVRITRGYADPFSTRVRYLGPERRAERCLLLAVQMKSGHNVVEMGREIGERIAALQEEMLPEDLAFAVVNDLPRQVDGLISGFVVNLQQAIALVLVVALLIMGWRPALIMAAAIPLCMISTIAVVRLFGVQLEQFSIASLIIALGMVVDNAIVVSDNSFRLLGEGKRRMEAMIEGASGLAVPILTSTLTTVFAFLPMLTIDGNSGEYIRSLPIVVATTLIVSYVVAMCVVPIFGFWLLRPPRPRTRARRSLLPSFDYDRTIRWCLDHKSRTIGGAALALVLAVLLLPVIGTQFFPGGLRDQFFIHVWLPESASIAATEDACRQIEDVVREERRNAEGEECLVDCTTCVGYGGPRLMLTLNPEDRVPNYGFMVVNTLGPEDSTAYAARVRERMGEVVGARVGVRTHALGPYVKNAVEYRLIGPDAGILRSAGEEMLGVYRSVEGALDPSHDWGVSSYQVEVLIDDEAANLAGVTNADVADTTDSFLSGKRLTTYREGDRQIDVLFRVRTEQRTLDRLDGLYVDGRSGKLPLDAVAHTVAGWQPSIIRRLNNERVIRVGCQVDEGYLANDVASAVRPGLDTVLDALPPGYRLEQGGELEKTVESQEKIGSAFLISFFLILLVLISQYNSIVKPLIVLLAVPLALIGALLGLFLTGWAMGFMPLLGIVSLAGVVINNAIILIDFIETRAAAGMGLRDAVAAAGAERMRPILLTTFTTVGGLLPLALLAGPMWAGMAWAMIFGLLLSTALTLLVVPTVYVLFVERLRMKVA